MGEGHSNVTGHGSRGPTGGVKGGPTGGSSHNSNRGSGWGTSNTPYGKVHHYSPSQFGNSNPGGGRGGNNQSQNVGHAPSLAQRPDMQAYMAVGGVPAVITLIDGGWGITLSRLSVVATFVESNLARIGSWAMRTSPIGVVVMGMMPSSIAPDPPMGHYFTTPVLPADRVTDMPKETLKSVDEVAVNVRISDVTQEGVQQAVLIKNPTVTQRVPVVKAVPTATPNVYTAPVPGVTPIHINVVDSVEPSHQTQPTVAGKPTATPVENAPVKAVTSPSGRHTHDAIIVFPDTSGIEPLYISMIRIVSAHELREEARREREAAEVAERQRIENERLAAEMAERQRIENERLAAEAVKAHARQQEATRQDTYSLPAYSMGSYYPLGLAVAGKGSITLGQEVTQGLIDSLRMALVRLDAVATSPVAGPMAVTVAAAFNPLKEEGESFRPLGWDRLPLASTLRLINYLVADPIAAAAVSAVVTAAFNPLRVGEGSTRPSDWDRPRLAGAIPLHSMWLSHGSWSARRADIELPVRMLITDADGLMEAHAVKAGIGSVSARVKQINAQYDAAKGAYTFTTDNFPPSTFTFTPVDQPGTDISPALPQPISAPFAPLHTGEIVIRHAVIHTVFPQPGLKERHFHDYIIWFPADSGLEPVYVYFSKPRYEPGTVTGHGEPISGIWLAGAGKDLGAPIPAHIADQLRGWWFSSFDTFRGAFWEMVGHDPELSGQFIISNRERMRASKAPKARKIDSMDLRTSFEIHHIKFIKDGGEVYNIDNLRVVTPRRHIEIHSKKGGK
ncbi:S-type pyocin domain-containing protein [Yersinia mollaretii]|uniref:S-type pyocin domain-containing protein n=1 Tax=Yersinia mollaretii TaxID=33060 RepID=UPI0011A43E65|nr:S-type pyocin domain-containing protein [Yersinia mollaretii]MDN0112016.1 S-type pyocin domain-containing protein [Yersinia mollaretii]